MASVDYVMIENILLHMYAIHGGSRCTNDIRLALRGKTPVGQLHAL